VTIFRLSRVSSRRGQFPFKGDGKNFEKNREQEVRGVRFYFHPSEVPVLKQHFIS